MLREIIRPTSEFYNIHIPKEYINHDVEILVLPFSYQQNRFEEVIEKKHKSLAGSLKKYADSSLIANEKDIAWTQVAEDKNALS
jgi:hypothetical protein